ncbi:MAG: hypothetical protein HYZ11_08270 [Candidatus Tectomicrobia bacterium]|uniref:Uncharacterized protein n=1 Tax=Tectimicrobiota bacterium TaxID=2528274 RepID=A0A932HYF5_UNCTE|nr:hypothetical protein [Candidatus Tectomicrobia bacterium]
MLLTIVLFILAPVAAGFAWAWNLAAPFLSLPPLHPAWLLALFGLILASRAVGLRGSL